VVLAGAGVAGVMAAAMAETRHRYEAAQGFADNAAVGFEVQLQQMMAPMLALAAFIHDNPNYVRPAGGRCSLWGPKTRLLATAGGCCECLPDRPKLCRCSLPAFADMACWGC
jgi:hypothetical protein